MEQPVSWFTCKTHLLREERQGEYFRIDGTVINAEGVTWTETHGGGGGGAVIGGYGGGLVLPAKTTKHTDTTIWLRLDSGKEQRFVFKQKDIPLREGHRVSLLGVRDLGKEGRSRLLALHNHETGETTLISDAGDAQGLICGTFWGAIMALWLFLAWWIPAAPIATHFHSWLVFFGIWLGPLVLLGYLNVRQGRPVRDAFQRALARIQQDGASA